MTDSIIEQIRNPDRFSMANEHILQILGKQRILKSAYYRDKRSGHKYCFLAGGFGWPRDPKEKPGFAVVVGVDKPKPPDEKPAIRCLEEAEAPTIDGLLTACVRLQKKYGAVECPDLFCIWWADQERADTSLTLFNHGTTKDPDKISAVNPYDQEKPNSFERHVNQISSSLAADPTTGKKRLHIGECARLRNYVHNAPADVAVKGNNKNHPALSALGGLIYTLMIMRPWTEFLQPTKTTPTVHDPMNEMREDDEVWWENESDDDGVLTRTV